MSKKSLHDAELRTSAAAVRHETLIAGLLKVADMAAEERRLIRAQQEKLKAEAKAQ